MQEQECQVRISQEDVAEIERTITATAKEQAGIMANNVATAIVRVIGNAISECCDAGIPREQMMADVVEMIVMPVIKGGRASVPAWMERSHAVKILDGARTFISRTHDRFTPMPVGSAKISPYQLEEIIVEDGISLTCNKGDAEQVMWTASDGGDIVGSGKDPTEALNDYFRKRKAAIGLQSA